MAWNGEYRDGREATTGDPKRSLLARHEVAGALPEFSQAQLPENYEAAKRALEECERIDECKSWSDKAAALASYARQAKDDSLRVMAERIHARAIRRCGELLKQVPSGQGSKNQHGEVRAGVVTRQQAAQDAGLSERQKVTALRLANVPRHEFDALIESHSPTVTRLAELGRERRVESRGPARPSQLQIQPQLQPAPSPHPDTVRAARARKMFWTIREFCQENAPADLAGAFAMHDAEMLREFAGDLRRWLEQFVASLPEPERPTPTAKRGDL